MASSVCAEISTRREDVRVDIAATEEYRRAVERAVVIEQLVVGRRAVALAAADESAAKHDESAVAPRVAGDELGRQTRALRKSNQHDFLGRYVGFELSHGIGKTAERRAEPRLVLLERCQKAVRVPRVAGGL